MHGNEGFERTPKRSAPISDLAERVQQRRLTERERQQVRIAERNRKYQADEE